jgi:hypothetical protein
VYLAIRVYLEHQAHLVILATLVLHYFHHFRYFQSLYLTVELVVMLSLVVYDKLKRRYYHVQIKSSIVHH